MGEDRPRIGVTWVTPGEAVSENYLNAVRDAGGEPVVLPRAANSWAEELREIRGLLLTGGGDVSPSQYTATERDLCELVDERRDRLEFEALGFARERGLPILGICRGFQLLNVAFGGSLVQDLDSEYPRGVVHPSDKSTHSRESRYHPVRVLPDTLLASTLDRAGDIQVNSRHHQGVTVDRLAPGLKVSALAPDGLVEGFETEGEQFVVGVQCHPERRGEAEAMAPVFRALIVRARDIQTV